MATAVTAARWTADGKTSFDDWEALTWSLGWTGRPRRSAARPAITSLAFMFDDVPDPVWKTSTGKWASQLPAATSGRGRGDGGGHVRRRGRPGAPLTLGRRPLDPAQGPDQLPADALPGDGKVLHRPLGGGAPPGLGGHVDLAHRVVFPTGGHGSGIVAPPVVPGLGFGRTEDPPGVSEADDPTSPTAARRFRRVRTAAPLVGQPLASAAPIDDKRAEAARLQDQLEAQGEQVSILAERYNRARLKVAEVEDGDRPDRGRRGPLRRAPEAGQGPPGRGRRPRLRPRRQHVDPEHHGPQRQAQRDRSSATSTCGSPPPTSARSSASCGWPRRTCPCAGPSSTAERKAARAASDEAAAASREAEAAEAAQRALLASVEGDISGLVAEEAARREAEEAAQRRLAAVDPARRRSALRRAAGRGRGGRPPTSCPPPASCRRRASAASPSTGP